MRKTLLLLAILLLPVLTIVGQEAILEYFELGIEVRDPDGFTIANVNFGDSLAPGTQIFTNNGSAELSLQPNGTIIRLTPNTTFTIDSVQGQGGAASNEFTIAQGRIRTVAARSAGADYRFRTATAVGGVRGTDFGIEVIPGQKDQLFVKEGSVEFTNNAGQSVLLGAGQAADAFASVFEAVTLSAEELGELFSGLDFVQLDPTQVPGQSGEPTPEDSGEAEATEPGTEAGSEATPQQEAEAITQAENAVMDWLLNFLGLEVGSVTISGETYGKAVLQPKFEIGSFRTQLYLPIIYTNDMFNPDDWYRPEGNNEWSFGTDQGDDVPKIVLDALSDFLLKFKYLEIGDYTDPFFLKIGNIESMTLGHGILINGYANDADFPAIRRLGLNLGINAEKVGVELLTNDLARPEIFGARFVWRPIAPTFPFGLGISAAADIDPTKEFERAIENNQEVTIGQAIAAAANPMFFNFALDLDFPIVRLEPFNLTLFGDVGGLMPFIPEEIELGAQTIKAGLRADALYNDTEKSLKNIGVQAGVFGNILFVDYRLEFLYYTGAFTPSFYNQPYDRIRGERALEVLSYLANPDAERYQGVSTMGIYGSGKVNILPELDVNLGYKWPWVISESGDLDINAQDYFHIGVELRKGLLPMGINGLIQYDRVMFRNVFSDPENFSLFDANTTVKGSIGVEVSPILDLVLSVGTSVVRDNTGTVQYDSSGNPKYAPTVSIETKIGL